ncbi:acryloyl-CoA reductase [Jeotgalibacillus sp. S-D1]|uniref:NADPH:quinone oxidoreductase family protein n=1 Tax=Jeotgalibacillus sp. S-D1 TaxID=2552189 RepID=UPI00105A5155|nr:acryloyl-CoA reductase [Jeotgalibacillus sp. S-D1]TDL33104.1 acryloyl-CoA reductase [Jeotgalibacillus sp. S-D1]
MSSNFQAVVVDKMGEDVSVQVKSIDKDQLSQGDVLIKVAYSSVNFKDGMAGLPNGNIVQSYPFVPGIDLSGTVVSSKNNRFKEGDEVIATSYEIGVSHYGGYSEYAKIPAEWIVPLPKNMTLKEAMIIGTAGFTAALSIHRLEANGLTPDQGDVLVTGSTGGVGSMAVAMLAKRGYKVVASTGKEEEHDFMKKLGADSVISRSDVYNGELKPLQKGTWQAAVDPVGGKSLAAVLSRIKRGGAVAVSGLTGGSDIPTTVHPFILRGVSLLGVDSAYCPMPLREKIWNRLADDLKPEGLEALVDREVSLEDTPAAMRDILQSKIRGRVLVRV